MMEWIKCSDKSAPKDKKFLFSYHCGIGLGQWGQCLKDFMGNSERTSESYILVLDPTLLLGNQEEPFEWDEEFMKIMEVSWMTLPNPPKE